MNVKTKKYLKITSISVLVIFVGFVAFILNETKDQINADFSTIDAALKKLQKNERNAGFAVSVFTKDSVLFKGGYGFADLENKIPYTTNTRQYIASVSKTTIGVALLKAQELGLLSVNDAVNKHLPFTINNPNFPEEEITIKQLATHTSSLDYNENVVESLYLLEKDKKKSLQEFIDNYFNKKSYGTISFTKSKPGTVFNYSNIGAGLAAYIIELTSKMTFNEFTNTYIFEPLNLENTSWFLTANDSIGISKYYEHKNATLVETETKGVVLYPARDLITNINDLTKFCQAMIQKSPKLLSNESYDTLLNPQLESGVTSNTMDNSGLFWLIDRNQYGITYQLTGMNGGDNNINTMMQFDSTTGLGYIFIGNTGQSEKNRVTHIWIFRTLVSLGDHYLMNNPNNSFMDKVGYKWHNLYSRINGLF